LLSTFLSRTNFSIVSTIEEFNAMLGQLKSSRDSKKRKPQVPDVAILDVPPAEIDAIVEQMDEIPELSHTPIIHIFARTGTSRLTAQQHQRQQEKYSTIGPESAGRPLLFAPTSRRVVVNYHKPLRLLPFLRILFNAVQGHDLSVPLVKSGMAAQLPTQSPSTHPGKEGADNDHLTVTATPSPALKTKRSFSKAPSPSLSPSPKVPGIRDNFTPEELEKFSSTRILIAEGV
jgi:hypothetical protein